MHFIAIIRRIAIAYINSDRTNIGKAIRLQSQQGREGAVFPSRALDDLWVIDLLGIVFYVLASTIRKILWSPNELGAYMH